MTIVGIPHLRQGNVIHLPDNYSLEVAEACSGLRSLVTLLALGALLAYLTQNSKWKAVTLFAATVPIAIAANIFRICVTAIGAYGVSKALAEDFIHELSGTIVFMFSLVCLLILSNVLRIGEKRDETEGTKLEEVLDHSPDSLLPFGAMATVLRYIAVEPDQPSHLTQMPLEIDGWKGVVFPVGEATAAVLQATEILLRGYTDSSGNYVGLYIAYFHDQKYGSQIHSPRHCLPGGGWVLTGSGACPVQPWRVVSIDVNRMTIAKRSRVDQMFYWFHTRSGDLASEYSLKFDLVRNSLLLSPTDAAIIRLTVGQGDRQSG